MIPPPEHPKTFVAAMTAVGLAVRAAVDLPMGVQILAGANRAALAVAHAVGGVFIRAEGFVFASVADEGILEEADAGPLLRFRRTIDAGHVKILVDVKKKHSAHAITADVSVAEMTKAADFFGADGIVITGIATGQPIRLRVALKPTSSIATPQQTIDKENANREIEVHGRHDPCIVPRAVPVIENMAALVLLDAWEIQTRLRPDWPSE